MNSSAPGEKPSSPRSDGAGRNDDTPTLPGDSGFSRAKVAGDPATLSAASSPTSESETISSTSLPPQPLVNHPRYELLQVLGSGGMGTVYKARHRFMDRVVALKVVHPRLLARPEIVARFEAEVRLAARLIHPNIVTAYDAEAYGSLHFLVMELIEGRNLADLLAVESPLAVERACDYARQAALGLQYAHEKGMIHRDVKPHNLICTSASNSAAGQGVVKILDFGLARLVQEMQAFEDRPLPASPSNSAAPLTGEGAVLGTWNYLAPEQAENPRTADVRADVYALGCTLYHLLVGQPPFWGLSTEEKRRKHREALARPISEQRLDVSVELSAIVARMMAKNPADRYQTAGEVAQALTAVRSPSSHAPAASSPPLPSRSLSRRRFVQVGAVVSLTAGASLLSYHYWRKPAHSPPSSPEPGFPPHVVRQTIRLQGHTTPVFSLAFSPDGQVLASGSRRGNVYVWDWRHQRQGREPLRGHAGPVRGVAYARDPQRIISASEDGTARVWDVQTGQQVRLLQTEPVDPLTSVAVSPDGKWILCGGKRETWLWEAAGGKPIRRLPRHAECVVFSPDGSRAVTASWDKKVHLWEVDSGRLLASLPGHVMGIKGVDFSADGTRILSVGEDRNVILWDANRYVLQRRWTGHKHWIWSVHFLPNGRRALTSGWDRTARLWDTSDGRELLRLMPEPEAEEFACQAIAPDGRWAACAGADGIIYLWELPT